MTTVDAQLQKTDHTFIFYAEGATGFASVFLVLLFAPSKQIMVHRKQLRHFHEPGHLHEFRFSCYRRKPLLTNDDWREKLSRCVDAAGQHTEFDLVAFVFMPEHVHLLTFPRSSQPEFGKYLALIKQPFSKEIHQLLIRRQSGLLPQLTVRERPEKFCFRFWQEGAGYDRNIYSPPAIMAAIDDIHLSPVRRGLCWRAIDWKWSSACYDLGEPA